MQPSTLLDDELATSKRSYEFRVWGERFDACRRLTMLGGDERQERLSDCYLLDGDPARNTKIRRRKLKVKHLVEEVQGFQWWSSAWHELAEALEEVETDDPLRAVFVTKHRRRFRIGSMKAESTTVGIQGRPRSLQTLAIEGPDIQDLIRLRAMLGLTGVPNLALHLAVGLECGIR